MQICTISWQTIFMQSCTFLDWRATTGFEKAFIKIIKSFKYKETFLWTCWSKKLLSGSKTSEKWHFGASYLSIPEESKTKTNFHRGNFSFSFPIPMHLFPLSIFHRDLLPFHQKCFSSMPQKEVVGRFGKINWSKKFGIQNARIALPTISCFELKLLMKL